MTKYWVSLCIPTNGIVEWVLPVVESIYTQGVSDLFFEVVICDNGESESCKNVITQRFSRHNNLKYIMNDAKDFMNQIKALKSCQGVFVKFVNCRCALLPGSLDYFIEWAKKYVDYEIKPVIYFNQLKCADEKKKF